MYNQFNYFYEIVFSVWFIFGFAFCLLHPFSDGDYEKFE